jgi:hypothetical protein
LPFIAPCRAPPPLPFTTSCRACSASATPSDCGCYSAAAPSSLSSSFWTSSPVCWFTAVKFDLGAAISTAPDASYPGTMATF